MRTQIALDPEHHAQIKQRAVEAGISMAEYIRRLVERDLQLPETKSDLLAIVGLGASGDPNVTVDRIKATGEAISAHHQRRSA